MEALASCEKAIALEPDYAMAHYNCGNSFTQLNRHAEALASYDKAIALKPVYAEAHNQRAHALNKLKRHVEAVASFERSITLKPDYEFLQGDLILTKRTICDWSDSTIQIARLAQKIRRSERFSSPFPILALIESPDLQLNASKIYANARYPLTPALPAISSARHMTKSRLGIFQATFASTP